MTQVFRLKNGTVLLSTEAPGGVYNSIQLKKIAELCSRELAVVKATEDQRLALFVKESEVQAVTVQLQAIGLGIRNYQDGLHQPVTCLGELCADHEQPALASAMEITKEIGLIALEAPLKIGLNGCGRSCVPSHTLDISIVGEKSGYRVSLGGKSSQFPELSSFFAEGVPASELPAALRRVIDHYKSLAEPQENLHSVLERCGVSGFVAALAPYSQDAAHHGDDPILAATSAGDEVTMVATSELPDETLSDGEGIGAETEIVVDSPQDQEIDEIPINLSHDVTNEQEFPLSVEASQENLLEGDSQELVANGESDFSGDDSVQITDHETEVSVSELPETASDTEREDSQEVLQVDDISIVSDEQADATDDIILEDEGNLDEQLSFDQSEEADPVSTLQDPQDSEMEEEPIRQQQAAEDDHSEARMTKLGSTPTKPGLTNLDVQDETDTPDAQELSDEEETAFEAKLEASIAEESRLLASDDADINSGERLEALELLEHDDTLDPERERQSTLADQALAEVEGAEEEIPVVDLDGQGTTELRRVTASSRYTGEDFRLAAISIQGSKMHVVFASGAYVDFDLESLTPQRERIFYIGEQKIAITLQSNGYVLELDGVKMFYPLVDAAAS